MELLAIGRLLWTRRLLLAIGVLLAIAAGMAASRAVSGDAGAATGVATAQVLLDTTDSLLVTAAPRETETLQTRVALLADLAASDEGRALIAREAGLPPDRLTVTGTWLGMPPPVNSPLVAQATAASMVAGDPYVLELQSSLQSPIIKIRALAPDPARAKSLAGAAVSALASLVTAHGGGADSGYVLETLARPRSEPVAGPSRKRVVAPAAAVFVFGLWCSCIVVAASVARRLRGVGRPVRAV